MDGDVLMEEPKVIQEEEEAGSIQPLTQPEDDDFEQKLWGYLSPCLSRRVQRVNLFRTAQEYTIGRNLDNMVILSGLKISNFHAVLKWNGLENAAAVVQIEDTSSNGTYINGENIGKGQQRLLKDGNEIAFGSPYKSLEDGGLYDYRFIFRALVSGAVKRALYNSYDISTELGKGSFATVYKALHRRSGEWVAVKVIHETHRHSPTNTASDVAQLNQSRELTLMKDLHHPSICQLREVFWNANGSIDLVLELVEGGDLLDLILIKGGLSEAMSKHITYQLCQALAYIHQKGITHRDLKPENVLLTKDNPPIVKVADFGLAKVVSSLTMLRTMCGTPSYLAPEVVTQQNSSGYDSLVDSWSVGVIEFSMLTNTTPFIESSVTDLRARTASRDIDWSQLEELYLTEEAIDFVRLLLDFNPRERMTMADALQHRWLINYIFAYPNIAYPDIVGVPSFAATHALARNGEDVSMRPASSMEAEAVSQGSEDLLLNGSSNSALLTSTNANGTAEMGPLPFDTNGRSQEEGVGGRLTPPGLTLHKKSALQRHNEEAEARHRLLAPSWEMVSFMNLQGQAQAQEGQEDGLTGSPQMEELYSAAAVNNGDSGMHILHRAVALEALFNSAENFHQPRWYPETRAEMLDDLYNWAIQESARPIRWLHGPVGTGKSAIMQTLCQRLQSASDLGGAFFFKRGHATCSNAKVLFATLAYQLALNTPHLTPLISRGVEADPAVVMSQMDVQLQKLIVEPCQAVPSTHTILLIDGLDECDTHGVQVEVLRSIQTAVLQHPNKLRFLIASRSEPHLRQVFEDPTFYAIHDSTNASFDDMRAYFLDEFSRIHREHRATMRGIPGPWPSPHIVEALVDKSAGDPIYAATVIRFIDNQNFHPPERLAAIQSLESDARISSLDQLYTQILSEVPTEFRSKLGDIRYGILHYATSPLYRAATVLQMEQLLELPQGKVRSILGTLDAVLEVDAADHISVRHASFVEFLQDPQRSRILHLDIDIDTQTMSKEKPAVPCTVMHFTSSLDGPSRPPAEKTGTLVIHSPCDYKAPE
ncbi:hypothetical protein DFH06DRAFT_1075569 [Mycena polygramma]|nr:hypothetical protein DFH06DRAFT_1075569 [Mycena polygramma]